MLLGFCIVRILKLTDYPNLNESGMSRDEFDAVIKQFVDFQLQQHPDADKDTYWDLYRAIRFYYADWPYLDDPYSNRHMFGKVGMS